MFRKLCLLVFLGASLAECKNRYKRQMDFPELFESGRISRSNSRLVIVDYDDTDSDSSDSDSSLTPVHDRFSLDYFDDPYDYDRTGKILHLLKKIKNKNQAKYDIRLREKLNQIIHKLSKSAKRLDRNENLNHPESAKQDVVDFIVKKYSRIGKRDTSEQQRDIDKTKTDNSNETVKPIDSDSDVKKDQEQHNILGVNTAGVLRNITEKSDLRDETIKADSLDIINKNGGNLINIGDVVPDLNDTITRTDANETSKENNVARSEEGDKTPDITRVDIDTSKTRRVDYSDYKISTRQLLVKINNINKITETIRDIKNSISNDKFYKMGYIVANIDTLKLTLEKLDVYDAPQDEKNILNEKLDLIKITMLDLVKFLKTYYSGLNKSYEEIN